MQPQHIGDLRFDARDRIQGGHRILRYQRDLPAEQMTAAVLVEMGNVAAVELDSCR